MPNISSGQVPRELAVGIVWDESAEKEFVDAYEDFVRRYERSDSPPEFYDFALREARWAVEIRLHQRFLQARLREGISCPSDQRKKLVEKWTKLYGELRCQTIVRLLRDKDATKKILEWRL